MADENKRMGTSDNQSGEKVKTLLAEIIDVDLREKDPQAKQEKISRLNDDVDKAINDFLRQDRWNLI